MATTSDTEKSSEERTARSAEVTTKAAISALSRWFADVDVGALEMLQQGYNTVYRYTDTSSSSSPGRAYAVRVSTSNRPRPTTAVHGEIGWLRSLADFASTPDTASPTCRITTPVVTAAGDAVVEVVDEEGATRPVCVFEWVAGKTIRDGPVADAPAVLGEALAWLHTHAETKTMIDGRDTTYACLPRERSDTPWPEGPPWQEEGKPPPTPPAQRLTSAQLDILRRGEAAILPILRDLHDSHPLRVIHGDLHCGNVMAVDGALPVTLIDFDDSCVAPLVQDIGIALFYLKFAFLDPEPAATWKADREALLAAYAAHRELPEPTTPALLDALTILRNLHLISFFARVVHEDLIDLADPFLAAAVHRVEVWLNGLSLEV